ncbi:hypothetical protein J3R82DRAFT_1035 [Butyriboletus roseoflavus]|nr:hypothetical protein J3R82DRAFT_1035 [Butyriboletus roseoflavus]
MDLKPKNIVIPSEGGRLSMIDFSVSVRVRGPDVKYNRGLHGSGSSQGTNRTTLLAIARQLMDLDPEVRPKMATVLEWMTFTQRGRGQCCVPSRQESFVKVCLPSSFDLHYTPKSMPLYTIASSQTFIPSISSIATTFPVHTSNDPFCRESRRDLVINLDDHEESMKRSFEDESDVEHEAIKKSRSRWRRTSRLVSSVVR